MHRTGSDPFVYNKRRPRPEEEYLYIGDGHQLKVEWIGSVDVVLHCKEGGPVALEDVALVPSSFQPHFYRVHLFRCCASPSFRPISIESYLIEMRSKARGGTRRAYLYISDGHQLL